MSGEEEDPGSELKRPFPMRLTSGRVMETEEDMVVQWSDLTDEEKHDTKKLAAAGYCAAALALMSTAVSALNNATSLHKAVPAELLLEYLREAFSRSVNQSEASANTLQSLEARVIKNVQNRLKQHRQFMKALEEDIPVAEEAASFLLKAYYFKDDWLKHCELMLEQMKLLQHTEGPCKSTPSTAQDCRGKSIFQRTIFPLRLCSGRLVHLDEAMQNLDKFERVDRNELLLFGEWKLCASTDGFMVTCLRAVSNLTDLHELLPYELLFAPEALPKEGTSVDLATWKDRLQQHQKLTARLQAQINIANLWRSPLPAIFPNVEQCVYPSEAVQTESNDMKAACIGLKEGQELLVSMIRNEKENAQKEMSEVKALCKGVKDSQEALTSLIKDGQSGNQETTVAKLVSMLYAERENAQRQMSEMRARCDRLEQSQESLKASLNAKASQVVAHGAWQEAFSPGSPVSPSQTASWHLVGCGANGSETIRSTSWISVDTQGPCCFLTDALFKVKTPAGIGFCEAKDLQLGSQVVAENGDIIEVKITPEHHVVHEMVELQTASTSLLISPDHRIVVPNKSTVARSSCLGSCQID